MMLCAGLSQPGIRDFGNNFRKRQKPVTAKHLLSPILAPLPAFFYHIMITRSNFSSKLGGAHRAPGPRRCPRSAAPCSTAVLCWSGPCVFLVAFSRASWYCRRRRRTSTTSTSPLCTSSKKKNRKTTAAAACKPTSTDHRLRSLRLSRQVRPLCHLQIRTPPPVAGTGAGRLRTPQNR